MLTQLNGNKWKNVRQKFSPIFTSAKLKNMASLLKTTSYHLVKELAVHAKSGNEVNLENIFELFTLDSIAKCAFGFDAQFFENTNSTFVKYSRTFNKMSGKEMAKLLAFRIPGAVFLKSLFKFNIHKTQEIRFFSDVLRSSLEDRLRTNTRRDDVVDLVLDLTKEMKKQKHEDENKNKVLVNGEHDITDTDIKTLLSTGMFFIAAGTDTTATTLAFAGHYLAKHEQIQEKLQAEIDAAYEECNDEIPDYNTIQGMGYVDQIIHETVRLQLPVPGITRVSDRDYLVPNTNIRIKKGEMVMINAVGIHYDEKYYPEPNTFNPDNFGKEQKKNREP